MKFLWNATRGHRFAPWRSEYLRWRLETYTGQPAATVRIRDFWRLVWMERGQFFHFLAWTTEMRGYANGQERD